jgi:hypothetical protein
MSESGRALVSSSTTVPSSTGCRRKQCLAFAVAIWLVASWHAIPVLQHLTALFTAAVVLGVVIVALLVRRGTFSSTAAMSLGILEVVAQTVAPSRRRQRFERYCG